MRLLRPGFLTGLGIGYVLGAKAGRERYEQIRAWWSEFTGNPTVQRTAERTRSAAAQGARQGLRLVQEGVDKAGTAVRDRLNRGNGSSNTAEMEGPPTAEQGI